MLVAATFPHSHHDIQKMYPDIATFPRVAELPGLRTMDTEDRLNHVTDSSHELRSFRRAVTLSSSVSHVNWSPCGGKVGTPEWLGKGEVPVAIDEAGVDVIGPLHAPDGLQTDSCALVGHDVYQAVLELVTRQIGTDEAGCVGSGVGQPLWGRARPSAWPPAGGWPSPGMGRALGLQPEANGGTGGWGRPPARSCLRTPADLELELHAGDVLAGLHLGQLLDVGVEAAGGYLGGAAAHGLQQGLVDEAVLVLRLHHVVALGPHERHVAVHIHRLLRLDPLQHGIDDDEAAGAAHAGTAGTDTAISGPSSKTDGAQREGQATCSGPRRGLRLAGCRS